MKVQRKHLRLALILLAAAVLYNMWVFLKPAARTLPQANRPLLASTDAPAPAALQTIDPASIPAPPPVEMSMPLSLARDPFLFADESRDARLRPAQMARVPDPIVRTILYSATRKTAIVDGRMIGVGDTIGSLTVAQIERDAVVFAAPDGQQRRVLLHRSPVLGLRR